MPLRSVSLRSEQPHLERHISASSPLLPHNQTDSEEPIEEHGNGCSIGDSPDGPHSVQDHIDEAIELQDIGDISRVESSGNGTEAEVSHV